MGKSKVYLNSKIILFIFAILIALACSKKLSAAETATFAISNVTIGQKNATVTKNTKDDLGEAGDGNMRQPESDEEKTEDSVKKLSGLRSGTGSLMGVMSEVFGLPEAGSAEATAAAKAEEDKFEI